jgi:fido (protein-threonine AMPylation protein)
MNISSHDFQYLWSSATNVDSELHSQAQEGRFISPVDHQPVVIDPKANSAYFFEKYSEILLAKHFLESNGHTSQVALDEYAEEYTGVIFTDYKLKM